LAPYYGKRNRQAWDEEPNGKLGQKKKPKLRRKKTFGYRVLFAQENCGKKSTRQQRMVGGPKVPGFRNKKNK